MAEIAKFRIIVINNDGTQKNEVVEAPSFSELAAKVGAKRIKSFTVTLAQDYGPERSDAL